MHAPMHVQALPRSIRSVNVLRAMPLALAGIVTALAAPVPAQAANAVIGTLTCHSKGSIGMILGSKESLRCAFKPANGGPADHYRASITKYGLDLGVKSESTMIWTVLGSTSFRHDALVGDYAGVSAEAAVAVGAGANALLGGSKHSVVLQPLSVEGQTGVNLAVGVTELKIR